MRNSPFSQFILQITTTNTRNTPMFRDTSVTTWIFSYFKILLVGKLLTMLSFGDIYTHKRDITTEQYDRSLANEIGAKRSVRSALSNNKKKLTRRRNFYGFCQDHSKYDNLFYRLIINFSETLPKEGKVTWVIQRVLVPQTSELTLSSTLSVNCNKVCLNIK